MTGAGDGQADRCATSNRLEGRRTFTVTPRDGAVEFRMHLRMSGPFAPLILKAVGDRQPEIDGFSLALRAHVERHQGSQAT